MVKQPVMADFTWNELAPLQVEFEVLHGGKY